MNSMSLMGLVNGLSQVNKIHPVNTFNTFSESSPVWSPSLPCWPSKSVLQFCLGLFPPDSISATSTPKPFPAPGMASRRAHGRSFFDGRETVCCLVVEWRGAETGSAGGGCDARSIVEEQAVVGSERSILDRRMVAAVVCLVG
jgi:hypothetical protein